MRRPGVRAQTSPLPVQGRSQEPVRFLGEADVLHFIVNTLGLQQGSDPLDKGQILELTTLITLVSSAYVRETAFYLYFWNIRNIALTASHVKTFLVASK